MTLLDLFCGRFGWSRAFAARGWRCIGIDLTEPPEVPPNCEYQKRDILAMTPADIAAIAPDFIVASSPCEQFSVHGMKHFHPNPPYPELGIALFNHTRMLCEAANVPYVMENVRAAQKFVGTSVHRCGPFHLWGNAVPPLMPQGISKGMQLGNTKLLMTMTREEKREYRKLFPFTQSSSRGRQRGICTASAATIPPLLSSCIADYAESILATATRP